MHSSGSDENHSVSSEEIPGIDLVFHVIQAAVIAVRQNAGRLLLESLQIVDNLAAEEGGSIFQRRLIDDHRGAFGFDALHDSLD